MIYQRNQPRLPWTAERLIALSTDYLDQSIDALNASRELLTSVAEAAVQLLNCLDSGRTVFVCGNGGSAADAQHFAAEVVGRFESARSGFPALALTVDTSVLTAIANDFGYDRVFSRQVEALGRAGDLLIGLSTSGGSKNVLVACDRAERIGLRTILLTGQHGPENLGATLILKAPASRTAIVQQVHMLILHMFCLFLDVSVQERS